MPTPVAPPESTDQAGASLSGRVLDASGAVVPGASISVRAAGGEVRPAVSSVRGEFRIGGLPAGQYELTVSMSGFRTARSRLEIKDQVDVRVDVRLELGSLVESVTVVGQRRSPAAGTPANRQAAWPSTPADYMEAAKMYYTQGRLADAEAMATRALELMREGRPQVVPVPPPPPPPPADPSLPSAPIRVGGDIKEPRKIRDVKPVYPEIALAASVQGTVILEATIAPDGTVTGARILRSSPLLDQAAIDAVRQWAFTPTLLNGVAVPVTMTVSVTFQIR